MNFGEIIPKNMFLENLENTFVRTLEKKKKHCLKGYNAKKKNNNSRNSTNAKKIPWVPNIGPKIRKEFKTVNKNNTFLSGKNLQSILCQGKPKLLPNSYHGVYRLDCSCNGRYIGEYICKEKSIKHVVLNINKTA